MKRDLRKAGPVLYFSSVKAMVYILLYVFITITLCPASKLAAGAFSSKSTNPRLKELRN